MHLLVAGTNALVEEILMTCKKMPGIYITRYGIDFDYSNPQYGKPIALHLGNGDVLLPLIELCESIEMPMIVGSAYLINPMPEKRRLAIINAPNLSLPMVRFMGAFPAFFQAIKPGMRISVLKSHITMGTKTRGGTVQEIAQSLGISQSAITLVSDPAVRTMMGVQEEHILEHSYEEVILSANEVEIRISAKTGGLTPHVEGVITLARAITSLETPLAHGVYEMKDILPMLQTT